MPCALPRVKTVRIHQAERPQCKGESGAAQHSGAQGNVPDQPGGAPQAHGGRGEEQT